MEQLHVAMETYRHLRELPHWVRTPTEFTHPLHSKVLVPIYTTGATYLRRSMAAMTRIL